MSGLNNFILTPVDVDPIGFSHCLPADHGDVGPKRLLVEPLFVIENGSDVNQGQGPQSVLCQREPKSRVTQVQSIRASVETYSESDDSISESDDTISDYDDSCSGDNFIESDTEFDDSENSNSEDIFITSYTRSQQNVEYVPEYSPNPILWAKFKPDNCNYLYNKQPRQPTTRQKIVNFFRYMKGKVAQKSTKVSIM